MTVEPQSQMDVTEDKPLVSVIIPCCSGDSFIAEAIQSALARTLHIANFDGMKLRPKWHPIATGFEVGTRLYGPSQERGVGPHKSQITA